MTAFAAIEELADEVRLEAAKDRARERLVRRLEDFARMLPQIGFTNVTLDWDFTGGMLVLSIDPDTIAVATPKGPVFRTRRGASPCPVCIPQVTQETAT